MILGDPTGPVERLCAVENPRQRVVIVRRNRVVLVVVAASTRDRQSEDGLGQGVDLLVDHVRQELTGILLVVVLHTDREEPGGDQVFLPLPVRFDRQQIAGDLLGDKAVVGRVVVEGIDDVVAVPPGMRIADVAGP